MPNPVLAEKLRNIRLERGKSLAEVAEASGLSPSFLSLVETGKSDITITRMLQLANYYDLHIADLLSEGSQDPKAMVSRRDFSRRLFSPREGIQIYLLNAQPTHAMTPMLGIYEPAGEMVEPASHGGEEFVYVLEGTLALEIDGTEVILEEGDSICFEARRKHRYRNAGDEELRTVEIVAPPSW